MKYIRFQQNLLKMVDARNGRKRKAHSLLWFETDNRIWVIINGILGVGIPKLQFYLDKEKIFKGAPPLNCGKKIIRYSEDSNKAVDTHMIVKAKIEGKRYPLHKFTTEEESIYVDENLLKDFELDLSHFTGINTRTPLYVWEDDELVGVVFPVDYEGGDADDK